MSSRPASMVATRIGGHDYPMRSIGGCKTCQDPNRLQIENDLIKGQSYASIARGLEGMPEGDLGHPTGGQISEHVKRGHIPIGVSVQRRLIERRAEEIGRSVNDAEDALIDYVAVSQLIVHKGFERMQDGEIAPEMADVLTASRFLHQVEQSAGGALDENAWRDALMAYMDTTRAFIPPERWEEYGRAMNANPILQAMSKAAEQKAIRGAEELD
jgi:hypothetical protein